MLMSLIKSIKKVLLFVISLLTCGYASYFVARSCFIFVLWIFDYELTATQRIFVTENGYLAFVAGMVVGMVVFWRALGDKGLE
jgi:hypothetical protein